MEPIKEQFYNLGDHKYEDRNLPYGNISRDTFKATFETVGDKLISSIQIPAGSQLKLLLLRFWSEQNEATLRIVQDGATNPKEAPDGIVDYVYATDDMPSCNGPSTLENPVHVLEGSVDFIIQDAQASANEYGLAWWGVQDLHGGG